MLTINYNFRHISCFELQSNLNSDKQNLWQWPLNYYAIINETSLCYCNNKIALMKTSLKINDHIKNHQK